MKTFSGQVADKMKENAFMPGQVTTVMNQLCIDRENMPTLNDYEDLQNNVSAFVKNHFEEMPNNLSVLVRVPGEEPQAFIVYK